MSKFIELKNISRVFSTEEVDTHALNDISVKFNEGEFVSIVGPSGCGKSTLMSLVGLLDYATSGSCLFNGTDITQLSQKQRAKFRNTQLGFIFQSFNLISDLTVFENVELPLIYQGKLNKQQRKVKVDKALEKVEMSHRGQHFPSQLSGGQQQRIAVARAIIGEPMVILADEPTGNLDSKNAQIVMRLLLKLNEEGTTVIMVTHDPELPYEIGRVLELKDGGLVKDTAKPTFSSELQVESA
jgi:putative ABC transport system ATP-binding protein